MFSASKVRWQLTLAGKRRLTVLPAAAQHTPEKGKQKSTDPFNGRAQYANIKRTVPGLHILGGITTKKIYCLACWFKIVF